MNSIPFTKSISIAAFSAVIASACPSIAAENVVIDMEKTPEISQHEIVDTLTKPGVLTLQVQEPSPLNLVLNQPARTRNFFSHYLFFGWLYDWAFPAKQTPNDMARRQSSSQPITQNSINIHFTINLGENPTIYGPLVGLVRAMSVTPQFQKGFAQFFVAQLQQPQDMNPISIPFYTQPQPLAIEEWQDSEISQLEERIKTIKEKRAEEKRLTGQEKTPQRVLQEPKTPPRKSSELEMPSSPLKKFISKEAAKQRSQYEQLIFDKNPTGTERFWEYVAQESWIAEKVYEIIRDSQHQNAAQFDIVPTKFKGTYKLIITTGDDQEVKIIKK